MKKEKSINDKLGVKIKQILKGLSITQAVKILDDTKYIIQNHTTI
jgi:hypothetical protein